MNFSFLLFAIVAGLAFRVVMHFVDKNRIKDEVETKGGRIVSIRWNPFARGWFFEKNERHYDVTYTDRSGTMQSTRKRFGSALRDSVITRSWSRNGIGNVNGPPG